MSGRHRDPGPASAEGLDGAGTGSNQASHDNSAASAESNDNADAGSNQTSHDASAACNEASACASRRRFADRRGSVRNRSAG